MVVNIEDAGFEIRDVVTWMYGSGFPKSLNISKAIDKAAGVKPIGIKPASLGMANNPQWNELKNQLIMPETTTDDAKQWEGWGTALKPACEFFTLARKPLSEKTVAENVLKWGTGGINIDDCRVGEDGGTKDIPTNHGIKSNQVYGVYGSCETKKLTQGRFPANLIHDGSQEVLDLFPDKNSRFFYCPKASKKDRGIDNKHPTVKPTALMRYLCRLITPPNGVVLDPYMGSGSTGKAAIREGFGFVGIEIDEDYHEIAKARVVA
jgi:site-specific DNA-methyltransferase (adenine-specific)